MYKVISTKNSHSDRCIDDNSNDYEVQGLNEPAGLPQKYGVNRIVRHIDNGGSVRYAVR